MMSKTQRLSKLMRETAPVEMPLALWLEVADELEQGSCRFNCRTEREAFADGFVAAWSKADKGLLTAEELDNLRQEGLDEYRRQKRAAT